MTLNEQAMQNLKRGLEYNNVSEAEALKILGVDSLDAVSSVGEALNAIKEYAEEQGGGNGQSRPSAPHRRSQSAPATPSTELAPIDEEVLDGEVVAVWGDENALQAMAYRARRFFNWARKLPQGAFGDELVLATIQYARLINANPASEIHAWWDQRNKEFVVTPDYTYYVKRAKEMEPGLNIIFDDIGPDDYLGVEKDDIAVLCSVQTPTQQELMVKLLDHLDYFEALSRSSTQRPGVVKKREMSRPIPTGWTWRTRAETRALRNALRAFGATETIESAAQNLDAAGLPPHVGQVLLDEQATRRLAKQAYEEEIAKQPERPTDPDEVLKRGRELLHGEEPDEVVEEPVEEETEPQVEKEPETDVDAIVTDIRLGAGWALEDEGWHPNYDQTNAHESLVKRCGAILGDAAGSDEMRHNLLDIIFEKSSTKALTGPEAATLTNRWQAGIGAFEASDEGKAEAQAILQANDLFAKAAIEKEEESDDEESDE